MNDVDEPGRHDSEESDEAARRGLLFLQQHGFRRLDLLEQRAAALEVLDRSSLAGDRKATAYNPLPEQVQRLLAVATDHLRTVQVTVEESGGKIPAMALFTLVRSAYETTGTGLWLLDPQSRDDRVLRSMQLTWDDRRLLRSVGTDLGKAPEGDAGFKRMEHRLAALLQERPGLRDKEFKKENKGVESVTDRLKSIAVRVPHLVYPPVVLWRMASGIAHGNSSMIENVLERRQLTPFQNGSADFRLSTSVVAIAAFHDAALDMVEGLLDLFDARNQRP